MAATRRSKKPEDIARKFQDDMLKLGLGVTFIVPGRDKPARVTTYCEACKTVSRGDQQTCPNCGEATA